MNTFVELVPCRTSHSNHPLLFAAGRLLHCTLNEDVVPVSLGNPSYAAV